MTPPRPDPTAGLTRRDLLRFAAQGAAGVVVSQSLIACASDRLTGAAAPDAPRADAAAAGPSCVITAPLIEGPFFVDERLQRTDIRSDPATRAVVAGVPLSLRFNVSRVASRACAPLAGAYVDLWHASPAGAYSDEASEGTLGKKHLRGYQVTDARGVAQFLTVYPGWYPGRSVHVHFKLRLFAGARATYEFTSQAFFDEVLTSAVHARPPYSTRGERDTHNADDFYYTSLTPPERAALTLRATRGVSGYAGVINLGVQVG